jgi:hypothetical protein
MISGVEAYRTGYVDAIEAILVASVQGKHANAHVFQARLREIISTIQSPLAPSPDISAEDQEAPASEAPLITHLAPPPMAPRLRVYSVAFIRGGLCEFRTMDYLPLRITNPPLLASDGKVVGLLPLPTYLHVVTPEGLTVSLRHEAIGLIEEKPPISIEGLGTKQ